MYYMTTREKIKMNHNPPSLNNKISDMSLLLGIAYALCTKYQSHFNTDEKQSYKFLTQKIDELYYKVNK